MSVLFYDLDADYDSSFVDYGYGNDWEGIVCPLDPDHQRAGRRITPLRIDITKRRVVDFSRTTLADIVITDRALKCFLKAGLTGFRVAPTEIVGFPKKWDETKTPKLWELLVVGTAGSAHPDSGIRLLSHCVACGSDTYSAYEHGIIVNESKWDGSDFFTVIEQPKHYLVTEQAKTVILENELTNVQLIPSHLLRWPDTSVKPQ